MVRPRTVETASASITIPVSDSYDVAADASNRGTSFLAFCDEDGHSYFPRLSLSLRMQTLDPLQVLLQAS